MSFEIKPDNALRPHLPRGLLDGYTSSSSLEDIFRTRGTAETRYANYDNNSSRLTGLLGLGVLFGPSRVAEAAYVAPVMAPAPAPMPMAPATQTCADGSVILATDACPVAPPPPPVPGPTPERG